MTLLSTFLAAYARSGLRGGYRLTKILADRLDSLQSVPLITPSGVLYADLRNASSLSLLANPSSQSGEGEIMRKFVKQGDVVFDIGAHLGYYTLLLSRIVGDSGKVFAFEPNPALLPSLGKTVRSLKNVELLEIALSDKEGVMDLFVPEDASMASISDWTDGIAGDVHTVQCDVKAIDSMINSGQIDIPNFIKCDVEGAELSVFRGASAMLDRTDAPVILFEVNKLAATSFGLRTFEYFEFLESLRTADYSFFTVESSGTAKLVTRDLTYANILSVPSSKLGVLEDQCEVL